MTFTSTAKRPRSKDKSILRPFYTSICTFLFYKQCSVFVIKDAKLLALPVSVNVSRFLKLNDLVYDPNKIWVFDIRCILHLLSLANPTTYWLGKCAALACHCLLGPRTNHCHFGIFCHRCGRLISHYSLKSYNNNVNKALYRLRWWRTRTCTSFGAPQPKATNTTHVQGNTGTVNTSN